MKKVLFVSTAMLIMCTFARPVVAEAAFELSEAQGAAEKYLEVLKNKDYASAYDMLASSNPAQAVRDLNLVASEFFHEEFGDIRSYVYKDTLELGALHRVLSYEVTYAELSIMKDIEMKKEGERIVLVRATDDTSSPEVLRKMISLMKRIANQTKIDNE